MTLFLLIALAVVALDRITKWLVIRNIPLGHEIPILGQWGLFTHIKNTGAAFGLFPGSVVPLIVVSLLASIIVVAMAQRARHHVGRLVPLGLILGGAIGNLIDRVFHGKVTDFILVGFPNGSRFPVFNVADSAVTIGVALLAIGIYTTAQPPGVPADGDPSITEPPPLEPALVTPDLTGAAIVLPVVPPPDPPSAESPIDALPRESR